MNSSSKYFYAISYFDDSGVLARRSRAKTDLHFLGDRRWRANYSGSKEQALISWAGPPGWA
jgi:hypothetical protein